MKTTLLRLVVAFSLCAALPADAASPKSRNEAVTARHFAALLAPEQVRLAELTYFLTQMPKGADLHHHYSGAIYAEQYLGWVDQQGYCIDKRSYRIEIEPTRIAAERALAPTERNCLSAAELVADDAVYRELLQRWSTKDFSNHGALQPPPDRQFFETFGYFWPVSSTHLSEGLQTLKRRAIEENVSYLETIFKGTPSVQDADFDRAAAQAAQVTNDDAQVLALLRVKAAELENDEQFTQSVASYVARVEAASAGIDDARFTLRHQAYAVRLLAPSQVFSALLAGFKAASASPLIVGVNLVGAENQDVSMRDYALHMQMFRFLKAQYPNVKLALHAGELTLGMVPPEGLKFHIDQAINVAGADRIGHGIDLAHESNAAQIMQTMRARGIPVEINLTSNEFILGVKGEEHPVTLYRKYGVPFVLSSDDPGVSRNTLANEYVLFASRYKPTYAEIKKLSYDALRYAFLPDAQKKHLLDQLDERYARFETQVAALQQGARKR